MKRDMWVLISLTGVFSLFLQAGCQQSARMGKSEGAEITFKKTIYDFGKVAAGTRYSCEFKFKNTGDAPLKIKKVSKTCGCTPYSLAKKEYAPGESGSLKIRYNASGKRDMKIKKHLYVFSNDETNPKAMVTIKAHIAPTITFKPEKMDLSLKDKNGGCGKITLRSPQPFSIEQFNSTAGCITADFDPSVKARKFVFKPKVDMQKLQKTLDGTIEIRLTHPDYKKVIIFFDTAGT